MIAKSAPFRAYTDVSPPTRRGQEATGNREFTLARASGVVKRAGPDGGFRSDRRRTSVDASAAKAQRTSLSSARRRSARMDSVGEISIGQTSVQLAWP